MKYPPQKPKRKREPMSMPTDEDAFEAPPSPIRPLPVIAGVAMLIAALVLWGTSFEVCRSLTPEELRVSSTPRARTLAADLFFFLGLFLAMYQFDARRLSNTSAIGFALLLVVLLAGVQSLLLAGIVVIVMLVSLRNDKHAVVQGIVGIISGGAITMCAVMTPIVMMQDCGLFLRLIDQSGIFATF